MITLNQIRELAKDKVALYDKTQKILRDSEDVAISEEARLDLKVEWEVVYADFLVANNRLNKMRDEYAKQCGAPS